MRKPSDYQNHWSEFKDFCLGVIIGAIVFGLYFWAIIKGTEK